jgi:phosphoserine phosphatase
MRVKPRLVPSTSTAAKSAGLSATELVYQPMLQAMSYLRANGFKTYIVTGGGQDFVRAYARKVYGGSAGASRRIQPSDEIRNRAGKARGDAAAQTLLR